MRHNYLLLTITFLMGFFVLSAQSVIYVDADASGANNGSTWQDAYTDLSEAIEQAQSGDQVWVAAGIYVPTSQPNYDIGSSNERFNHFTLKNGVTLLGGFAGDETSVDQRDLEANKTVLSGDLGGDDDIEGEGYVADYSKVNGENILKLFYFPEGTDIDTTAVLDGFVLSGAVANNDVSPYNSGAAFYCLGASPKIVNCDFYGNYAKHWAGAIFLMNSSMVLENCDFAGNKAESHAGAFYYENSKVRIKDCEFNNNIGKYGGAISGYRNESVTVFDHCHFEGNVATNNAGVMTTGETPNKFINCSFINNEASWGGALVLYTESSSEIINCRFEGNHATGSSGGAIFAAHDSKINIYNSAFRGNETSKNGGAIYNDDGADLTAYNTLFTGNVQGEGLPDNSSGSAIYAKDSKVTLVNSTVASNYSYDNTHGAAVNNWNAELIIQNCIIWENTGSEEIRFSGTAVGEVTNSDVQGGFTGSGNMDVNPLFLDDIAASSTPSTGGDYRLWGNSPVNNKGINTKLPDDTHDLDNDGDTNEPLPYDLNGKERVFAGVVDMGCYEQQFESVSGNKLNLWSSDNGTGQYINMGDNLTLNGTDFTIETWIEPWANAKNGSHHNICGNNDNGTVNRPPTLYIFQYDRIHYGYGDGTNWNSGDTEKALKIGQWNHIALTFNNSTNTMKVYANGRLLETLVGIGEVSATPLKYLNNDQELRASLDEFRVWKEERTQEELIANMNSTLSGNEENLALYYSFDQVSSGEIEDQAGINNGTMMNGPGIFNSDAILTPVLKPVENVGIDNFSISWYPVPDAYEYYIDVATDPEFNNLVKFGIPTNGATEFTVNGLSRGTVYYYKVTVRTNNDDWGRQYAHTATKMTPPGNAFAFDGSTYIDATDVCKYDLTSGATIECWAKLDFSSYEVDNAIWACNTNTGGNNYVLIYSKTNSKFRVYFNGGDTYFDGSAVNENEWNHVALTINPGNTSSLYINGVQIASYIPVENPFPYGSLLSIGQEYDGTAQPTDTSNVMKGAVDEFRVWNDIRTQAEIQANMNQTLTGNENGLVTYYNFDLQTGNKVIDNANIFDGEVVGTPNWIPSTATLQDFTAESSAQTTSGFTLTWDAVDGAGDYLVDVATDAQFTYQIISAEATAGDTTYNATGLNQGTKYYFRVFTDQNDTSMVNYTNTLMEIPGNALVFDGKDDYVDISQIAELGSKTNATMECWVYMDPTETHGRFIAINTITGGNKYLLSYESSTGYTVYNQKAGTHMASNIHTKGSWVHLAVTFNGNISRFYLNGVLVSEVTGGDSPAIYPGNLISLGQEFDGDNASDFLKGAMDEVRFWDVTLSQNEIRANMHKKLSGDEAGLFAYYDFDQNEGQFVFDKINGLDGTILGDPQWQQSDAIITPLANSADEITPNSIALSWNAIESASDYYIEIDTDPNFSNPTEYTTSETTYEITGLQNGTDYFIRLASETTRKSAWGKTLAISTLLTPPGNAYHFDGTNYISMDGVTNEDYSNGATIDLWIKPMGFSGDRAIIWANNTTTGGNHYFLMYNPDDKKLKLYSPHFTGPEVDIDLNNTWNHVAVVLRSGSASYIYVNGKEIASFTASQDPLMANSLFSIGQEWDTKDSKPVASDFYIGAIDEVRIWNKALSLNEIKSYYHTAIPGDEPGLVSYFNFDETKGSFVYDANGTYSGEVIGNTQRAESKALITPFTTDATNIANDGFTANWEAIDGATTYYLRVATDQLLTNPVEGWESVETGNVTTYDVTGLAENTVYYYGAMSETDRLSAWSPGSDQIVTTGGTAGELAANLNGTDNYIDLSDHIARFAGKNSGAITGWFKASEAGTILKMTGATEHDNVQIIVGDFYEPYTDESLWFICSTNGDYNPSFGVREGHDKYLDNNWHHFAVIMGDGNNRFVIDGEEKEAFFHNGTAQSQEFTNITGPDSLYVGKGMSIMVDELAFYKNPITNSEVVERAHKKLTGNEIGLIAYYNFDNSNPIDASGLGRDGVEQGTISYVAAKVTTTPFLNQPQPGVTIADLSWIPVTGATEYRIDVAKDADFQLKVVANQPTTTTSYQVTGLNKNSKYFYRVKAKVDGVWSEFSGKDEFFNLPGNTLVLDGVDDYVNADGISNYSSNEATIECWIKAGQTSGTDAIWAHNNNINGDNQYVLMYDSDAKELNIATMDPDGSYGNIGPFLNVNLLTSWHHLAVSIIKDGESFIYVDGKKVGQFNHHLPPIVDGYQFAIGQEWDSNPASPSQFFNGEIDEFRVWNIALTEEEIRANMNVSEPEGADEHYIAHYTFDEIHLESNGVYIFKDMAKQNDATLVNGPVIANSEGVINPITLEATDITPGSFMLHLNDIASAQSYELEIAHDSTFVPPLAMHQNIGKVSNFNVTNMCPGVNYFYRVRAIYDENNISAWSAVDTVTTIDNGASINEFVATTGDYSGLLKLSWEVVNEYLIDNFIVKRRVAETDDEFELVASVENNGAFFYTDTTAQPGTYYEYIIQGMSYCYDNDTEIDTSNIGFCLPTVTVGKEDGRIRLDWVYADNFAQNLEIVRKDIETGIEQVFQEVADSTYFLDSTMSLCVPYQYQLISKTRDFGDVAAKPVTYTLEEDIFEAINTLDASKGYQDSKISLNWVSHKQSIIDEYQISRRKYALNQDFEVVKIIDKGTTQVWIDEDAIPGEYYEYCIVGIGTCGDNAIFTDSVFSVGFRQPEGVINGQVNYEGGNPVGNVKVTVKYDEADKVYGSCLEFDGADSLKLLPVNDFSFDNGLTLEMWVKPDDLSANATLFQNSGLLLTTDTDGNITATSGGSTVVYNPTADTSNIYDEGSWNYLGVTAGASELNLFVNGQKVAEANAMTNLILDSVNIIGSNYTGLMDEFRLWNTMRSDSLINRFHGVVLPREQDGLISALRFDEKRGALAFDHTRTDNEPNKNHGVVCGAQFSENVPSLAKLALASLTEPTGNYQVNGIWFKGSGETFSITPSFGVHEFDPATRNMLISENSLIYNNQDFTDISSFLVTGNVKYYNADFPVDGVMLYIDGQLAVDVEGSPIVTDEDGNFEIEVPIGDHFIAVAKMGHIFSEGYFPPKDDNGEVQLYNFNDNVSGIQFIDSTFMKVAGRIVGGTIEGDKEIGFGKSVNNLGVCSFTVEAVKGYPIDGSNSSLTFYTDSATGEYEAYLFPEQYSFVQEGLTHIGNDVYDFNSIDDLALLDLSSAPPITEVTDTVTTVEIVGEDTIYTDTVYTYTYNHTRNWIYRSVPDIEVTNLQNESFISDSVYYALDENQDTVALELVDGEGNDLFMYPVFTKGLEYNTLIKVYEEYENADNGNIDQVPVNDGLVTVINGCGNYPAPVEYEIDSGVVEYSFYGGFPNPTIDSENSDWSYTKTFEVHAATGNGGAIHSQWPASGEYRAYVFGGIPTGNNFVTNGPDLVDFILRDPPGSNSHSYFEEGFTVSNTTSSSFSNSQANSLGVEVDLGWKVTTFVGFGAGVIMENEQIANVETGVETERSYSQGHSYNTTTTFTQSYNTSSDPLYVGDAGDIFFGHATNISYGVSNFIKPIVPGTGENELEDTVNGFTIGLKKSINFGLEYSTDFIYTQNHIENYLIPDLESMAEYHDINGNPDSAEYYMEQVNHWKKLLGQNEYQKYVALNFPHPEDKNISFDAGSIYEQSMTTEVTETVTTDYEFNISAEVASEVGLEIGSVGTTWSYSHTSSQSNSQSSENSSTESTTIGFVLEDGDQGDYFSVDILKDYFGNGPIFSTKGGQSACPYEGGNAVEYADFYTEGVVGGFANGIDLDFPTMRIEVPEIAAVNSIISGVPDNQPAIFTLKLSNLSEVNADNWFILKVDGASNPYGAKLRMDGASIVNGVAIMVPGGTTLTKTLEFEKGRDDINDYEDVRLILHSECQFDPTDDIEDISDTLSLTVNFIPTCSNVAITNPTDNWLVNVANNDTLPVQIGQYNLQHNTLEKIAYQYRPASSSAWMTQAMFFHDTTEFGDYSGEKYKINGAEQINYMWDMHNLQDRDYQIRVVSLCSDESIYEDDPLTGTLDGIRPQLFGAPSPADGILDPNDEIMITFNEPIEEGLVSYYNIDVEGVLNGSEISHGTSLLFDGQSTYAETPSGINLQDKSFSIEFWMNKPTGSTGTVISQGIDAQQNLEIRFTDTDIEVVVDGLTYNAENTFDDEQWHHWAVVYNNQTEMLRIFADDQILLEESCEATSASGSFVFGNSAWGGANHFEGKIHDVRIWKRALAFTDIIETMNIQLTGNELGIFANWPMSEGEGNVVEEIVHSRHAVNYAEWIVEPSSSAYSFNGTDQALIINTASIPVIAEMDLGIELWFKGAPQAADAYLFSNGNPAIDGYPEANCLGIKLNTAGYIVVENNGVDLLSSETLDDDQWHHVAFVINRRAYASLYIDGEKVNSIPAPEFGSMQSAFAYIGGLGYIDNTQVQQISDRFTGVIDELRIWKTARKQEQIQLYKNTRLAGNEAGLIAYFPFETYEEQMGVLVSVPTLEDLSIDPYDPNGGNHCGTLTVVGEETISDIAPNIKRERPKQSVNFDYVINNDKIIITPTDELALIEQCILEVTVKNIEDKNGNVMASPATWTAYINKNQVRWEEEYFEFEKEMEESLSFQTVIQNNSGVVQPFTLSNMPSWLTVAPVSGTIPPDDEITVTFTVADGLNIGDYSEDVFLESSSGFNERLTLNLRVYKQAPNWTVDEDQFSSSMNIIAQVRVQDVFSTDAYDMIGVFAGEECCGVAHLEYKENYDDYFLFLVVYGNENGEELNYKFWDASEGTIFTDVTPEFDFEANALHGSMAEPVLFNVGIQEDNAINLIDGWKWISFNLNMNEPGINDVMSELEPHTGDIVKHGEFFASYDSTLNSWVGSLTGYEIGKLYRIKYSSTDILNYQGAAVMSADHPITIEQGWNRIGFVPSVNLTVSEALAGFEPQTNDVIKGQFQFAMFDGYEWIGSLNYMEPGKGYMYNSQNSETFTFTYPEVTTSSKETEVEPADIAIDENIVATDFEYAMSVVAKLEVPFGKDYKVLAYIDEKMVGKSPIVAGGTYHGYTFITIYGNSADMNSTVTFELSSGNETTGLSGTVQFDGYSVFGTLDEPLKLGEQSTGASNHNFMTEIVDAYPNPFSDELVISFSLLKSEIVMVEVYNLVGEKVIEITNSPFPSGTSTIEWNGINEQGGKLKDGVYLIHVQSESLDKFIKVVKK